MTDQSVPWGSLRKPDEPPAPTTEEWLSRLMSRSLNDLGAPLPSVRQTPRQAPSHDGPFIRKHERETA